MAFAGLLLIVGVLLARPILRGAVLQQVVGAADIDGCEADPTSWGSGLGGFSMFAYDEDGVSANPEAPTLDSALLAAVRAGDQVAFDERADVVFALTTTGRGDPCAYVRTSTGFAGPVVLRPFASLLLATTVLAMFFAAIATWWLVVRPLRVRVDTLSRAADGVGREGFGAPMGGPDALGHIAEVLAASHERIVRTREALVRRNRALEDHLAGIAHDLRTPLASMQLALEAVAADADGTPRDEARRALADVVYLSSLVENLHEGTRLQHDVDVAEGEVDLVDVVMRLERRFAIVGRHRDVEVAASVPEGALIAACSPALAERAIANLVQNAVEHQQGPGHVALLLTRSDGGGFALDVVDDGPGLPAEVRASLSAETFLLDDARQRGPGLGMMITAEIARRAGWELDYEAVEPRGTRARLTGPVSSQGTHET